VIILNTNLNSEVYNAAVYLRLSREDGDKEESDSIVNQKALIKDFLKSNPDIRLYEEKVDDGYTGVNFERPAFQSMMEDIKSGKVNCVIVKDLSRFGRNYIEAGRYIEKIFPFLGVRFIAINDNVDSTREGSQSDDMLVSFKNLINDAYCRDISIKIRSHLEIKRKNGDYLGAFAPYGYKKSLENKNQLMIDEKAAAIIRDIFKWKIEGLSSLRIANKLNELGINPPMEYKKNAGEKYQSGFKTKANVTWGANSVTRILKNEIYTGVLLQGRSTTPNYKIKKRIYKNEEDWIRIENSHEPIVTTEVFHMVQNLLKIDTRVSPNENSLHLFSGIVKCGWCGSNMTRRTVPSGKNKHVYLTCIGNKKHRLCTNNENIPIIKFEKVILDTINFHIQEIIQLESMLKLIETIPYSGYKIERLDMEILDKRSVMRKNQTYMLGLYEDYKDDFISEQEYTELKNHYAIHIRILEKDILNLKTEKEEIAGKKLDTMEWIQNFTQKKGFEKLTRGLLLELVEEILVYDKKRIEVVFKFQNEYKVSLDFIRKMSESLPKEGKEVQLEEV